MYPIIDFRNARYQGQTKNQLPHGVGILIDKNFLFCAGQWTAGQIQGAALVVFPSGLVFCGHIANKEPSQLCIYQLPQDHVKLITYAKQRRSGQIEKVAGILPLLKSILEIDNTSARQGIVTQQHPYSIDNEIDNINCITKILNLQQNGPDSLTSHRHCLQFLQDHLAHPYNSVFQYLINESKGRTEYFFGLRGQGLGIKIQPLEQPGLNLKKKGRVYLMRGVGVFTSENQMKDIGLKTIDNAMKEVVMQQGIFSLPNTLIKYQLGKRPRNCLNTFYNYLKRSLYYRDQIISTDYIYALEKFVGGFNENLRKTETERLAHFIIENPNNSGTNLIEIQQRRLQKEREKEQYLKRKEETLDTPNPYNPNTIKFTNPDYNLQRAKDQIYRSASKRKNHQSSNIDYNNVQYIDPNYKKVTRLQKQPRNYQAYVESKNNEPNVPSNNRTNDYDRRYTPKRKYSPVEYSSPRQKSKDRKYYHQPRYEPEGNKEYTPVRRQNAHEEQYRLPLQKTVPRSGYDYYFQKQNSTDRSKPPRQYNTSPDTNFRRRIFTENSFQ